MEIPEITQEDIARELQRMATEAEQMRAVGTRQSARIAARNQGQIPPAEERRERPIDEESPGQPSEGRGQGSRLLPSEVRSQYGDRGAEGGSDTSPMTYFPENNNGHVRQGPNV